MRIALAAAVVALTAAAAEKTVTTTTPSQTIAALVSYQPPKSWEVEEYANGGGADPVIAFIDGSDRLVVRVFGAPGSGYKSPAAFLAGPAAATLGRKPEKAGATRVAGRELALYKRGFPVNLGDPHAPPAGPPRLGKEVFCVLPASGGRFVVLSYARESPAPDRQRRGEKAWAAFLKSVKLVSRKT